MHVNPVRCCFEVWKWHDLSVI